MLSGNREPRSTWVPLDVQDPEQRQDLPLAAWDQPRLHQRLCGGHHHGGAVLQAPAWWMKAWRLLGPSDPLIGVSKRRTCCSFRPWYGESTFDCQYHWSFTPDCCGTNCKDCRGIKHLYNGGKFASHSAGGEICAPERLAKCFCGSHLRLTLSYLCGGMKI